MNFLALGQSFASKIPKWKCWEWSPESLLWPRKSYALHATSPTPNWRLLKRDRGVTMPWKHITNTLMRTSGKDNVKDIGQNTVHHYILLIVQKTHSSVSSCTLAKQHWVTLQMIPETSKDNQWLLKKSQLIAGKARDTAFLSIQSLGFSQQE